MKVTDKQPGRPKVVYGDVPTGATFAKPLSDRVLIKTDHWVGGGYLSIDLRTGEAFSYSADTKVLLVDAEVVIHG